MEAPEAQWESLPVRWVAAHQGRAQGRRGTEGAPPCRPGSSPPQALPAGSLQGNRAPLRGREALVSFLPGWARRTCVAKKASHSTARREGLRPRGQRRLAGNPSAPRADSGGEGRGPRVQSHAPGHDTAWGKSPPLSPHLPGPSSASWGGSGKPESGRSRGRERPGLASSALIRLTAARAPSRAPSPGQRRRIALIGPCFGRPRPPRPPGPAGPLSMGRVPLNPGRGPGIAPSVAGRSRLPLAAAAAGPLSSSASAPSSGSRMALRGRGRPSAPARAECQPRPL